MKRLLPLTLVATAISLGRPGLAATLTVTSAADSGAGTLRQALADASAGDTIDFAVTGAIVLTSGSLVVDKALTITGPGAHLLSVERDPGAGDFRVFFVTGVPVVISGLAIRHGRAETGGGLLNWGQLTLQDCVVADNAATGGLGLGGAGGGLHNDMADLCLERVVVTNNLALGGPEAGQGGGIFTDGTMSLDHCLIAHNLATGAGGAAGGGLYSAGTTKAALSGFTWNTASANDGAEAQGGAIFARGDLTLEDCSIHANTATGGSMTGDDGGPAWGGGLASRVATVRVSRSTLSDNLAVGGDSNGGMNGMAGGGGVYATFGTTAGLTNCTLSGNRVREGEGGLAAPTWGAGLLADFATVYLFHSTVASNAMTTPASDDGAGVYAAEGVTLECHNTIVAANTGTLDLFVGESLGYASHGYNLIGAINVPTDGPVTPGPGDLFHISAAALQLGPLQDNGGPTWTHALGCGSLALNAGVSAHPPPTDQRGFPRVLGSALDVGAYESESAGAPLTLSGCPGDLDLGCNPTSLPGCSPSDVTVTGGCGAATVTCRVQDSASGCAYSRLVTYTATDAVGQTATCTRRITWTEDRTAPVFVRVPSDLNLGVNPTNVPGCNLAQVEAITDCGPAVITCVLTDSGTACARTRTVVYTATSPCGNTATHTQRITWTVLAPGDLNGDGCVDLTDYNLIMAKIRAKSTDLTYDLNGDRRVTIADARSVVALFTNPGGAPCSP